MNENQVSKARINSSAKYSSLASLEFLPIACPSTEGA